MESDQLLVNEELSLSVQRGYPPPVTPDSLTLIFFQEESLAKLLLVKAQLLEFRIRRGQWAAGKARNTADKISTMIRCSPQDYHSTLEPNQGQISSQSPTDASTESKIDAKCLSPLGALEGKISTMIECSPPSSSSLLSSLELSDTTIYGT